MRTKNEDSGLVPKSNGGGKDYSLGEGDTPLRNIRLESSLPISLLARTVARPCLRASLRRRFLLAKKRRRSSFLGFSVSLVIVPLSLVVS